jgi:hypothetical protein
VQFASDASTLVVLGVQQGGGRAAQGGLGVPLNCDVLVRQDHQVSIVAGDARRGHPDPDRAVGQNDLVFVAQGARLARQQFSHTLPASDASGAFRLSQKARCS